MSQESWSSSMLRAIDAFQKPIAFTHNKKDTYKTKCGGLLTLLIYVLMIVYAIILITQPLKADSISIMDDSNSGSSTNGSSSNSSSGSSSNSGSGSSGNSSSGCDGCIYFNEIPSAFSSKFYLSNPTNPFIEIFSEDLMKLGKKLLLKSIIYSFKSLLFCNFDLLWLSIL